MTRLLSLALVLGLFLALSPAAPAQEDPRDEETRDEYDRLIREAARLLEGLPADQRDEIKRHLVELETAADRAAYLRKIIDRFEAPANPPAIPQFDPDALREALMEQGLEQWKKMTPAERQEFLGQAQKFLEFLPPEQRDALQKNMMKELFGGGAARPKQEEDDPRDDKKKDLPPWAEDMERYADEARQLYEAWQAMPPESRQQMVDDILEGLTIYFEDNIQPELEREAQRLAERAQEAIQRFEMFQQLPEEEKRRQVREGLRGLARRVLGEKNEDSKKEEKDY